MVGEPDPLTGQVTGSAVFTENPSEDVVSQWIDRTTNTFSLLDFGNDYVGSLVEPHVRSVARGLKFVVDNPTFKWANRALTGYSLVQAYNVLNNPASTQIDRAHAWLDVGSTTAPILGGAIGVVIGAAVGAVACGPVCATLGAIDGGMTGYTLGSAFGAGLGITNIFAKAVLPDTRGKVANTPAKTLVYSANPITTGGGTVSIDPSTGVFHYQPTLAQREAATAGTIDTFTVTATNLAGNSATQTIEVSVSPLDARSPVGVWQLSQATNIGGPSPLTITLAGLHGNIYNENIPDLGNGAPGVFASFVETQPHNYSGSITTQVLQMFRQDVVAIFQSQGTAITLLSYSYTFTATLSADGNTFSQNPQVAYTYSYYDSSLGEVVTKDVSFWGSAVYIRES
jgi:VCBS repeat-containing protein